MKNEIIIEGKTVDDAVRAGAEELGVTADRVVYEVIEDAKKGFLGMGSTPAKVKVTFVLTPLEAARKFAETLIADLGLEASVVIHDDGDGEALMTIVGNDAGTLIGHHGDTLDSFQYLVNLAANKKETDERKYTRISVDIENYREKREETLRQLARRMAAKVKKTGKSVSLEPMVAYERRIIHAEVKNCEGVATSSVGVEGNRRVVIFIEGSEKPTEESVKAPSREQSGRRRGGDRRRSSGRRRDGQRHDSTDSDAQSRPTYKRSDLPHHEPRKIEKAKDLDSYFAKLKEFSSTFTDD